jgi:hypothetical protein
LRIRRKGGDWCRLSDAYWFGEASASASSSPALTVHLVTVCLGCSVSLIYFVHYHIINYVHKHKTEEAKTQKWDTEETQTRGLEEGHSAIYPHGKDQDGVMVGALAGATMDHAMERQHH